jgi:hypothetical protein
MMLEDFYERFGAMPKERKIQLLALMVMALTIEARSKTIDLLDSESASAYKGFNELQHLIANQLCAYVLPKGNVRPDSLFWHGLEELAANFHLQESLLSAVAWSFSRE